MRYMSGAQNGGYHICKKCNYLELSNIPYDIDKVADRGRDQKPRTHCGYVY